MKEQTIRDVQEKILEIMRYIDKLCRENDITYFIMGGTALGAVRHGGFIPWDDDLDIFMTPAEYGKFKNIFERKSSEEYILQEWRTTPNYLEYAKVRMHGTTFIEYVYKDRNDMHHGIYVDIMILHKCPLELWKQKLIYLQSKYVTLYALSQRNWVPKSMVQTAALAFLKILPNKMLVKWCYKNIYRYDNLEKDFKWCYFITPAKFRQGIFDASMFLQPTNIDFEGVALLASENIKKYLEYRYGDYMRLPSEEQRKAAVHAYIYDVEKDYTEYVGCKNAKTLEVMMAVMHEKEENISCVADRTGIKTDVLIINQCDHDGVRIEETAYGNIRCICTEERGLSRSRNMALKNLNADFGLICDDDEILAEDYEKKILTAFAEREDVDIMCFQVERKNKRYSPREMKIGFLRALKVMSVQVVVKKESIRRADIRFDEHFGSGTVVGSGEENIFLFDCLKAGLKVYYVPVNIGAVEQTNSQWFKGFDENYFLNRGKIINRLMGKCLGTIYIFYFALSKYPRYRENLGMSKALGLMIKGLKG